ncbi:MAG TPA: hypothetical protein VGC80_07395, partial [Acetobacteraceae bacterium]
CALWGPLLTLPTLVSADHFTIGQGAAIGLDLLFLGLAAIILPRTGLFRKAQERKPTTKAPFRSALRA